MLQVLGWKIGEEFVTNDEFMIQPLGLLSNIYIYYISMTEDVYPNKIRHQYIGSINIKKDTTTTSYTNFAMELFFLFSDFSLRNNLVQPQIHFFNHSPIEIINRQ